MTQHDKDGERKRHSARGALERRTATREGARPSQEGARPLEPEAERACVFPPQLWRFHREDMEPQREQQRRLHAARAQALYTGRGARRPQQQRRDLAGLERKRAPPVNPACKPRLSPGPVGRPSRGCCCGALTRPRRVLPSDSTSARRVRGCWGAACSAGERRRAAKERWRCTWMCRVRSYAGRSPL